MSGAAASGSFRVGRLMDDGKMAPEMIDEEIPCQQFQI